MRVFEILILILIVVSLVGERIIRIRKTRTLTILPFIVGGLIVFHLIVERYRWQMVPIYIFTGLYILINLIGLALKKDMKIKNKVSRNIFVGFTFLLYAFSIIFPLLLPVVDLPEPSGKYEVGTINFRLVDDSREEIYTKTPDDSRNILVSAWYPADIKNTEQLKKYWDSEGVTGEAYSINSGMGTFWYSHLALSNTNSYKNAPISTNEDAYPVIIYSPSFYGLNTENTVLFEEFASNGYIVFSIAHTYETIVSIYPDDEIVYGDLSHFNEIYDDNEEQEEMLYEQYNNATSEKAKMDVMTDILVVDDSSTQMIKTRTEDVLFLLDEMERIIKDENVFKGKLNLDSVGIIGWSFGGATAQEAGIKDDRIKAIVNIDGWPYGEMFNSNNISQPFMLIQSDSDDEMEKTAGDLIYSKLKNSAYHLKIQNTTHINFWDFPLFFDVYKYIGYWGMMDAQRMGEIHKAYTVSFFDKYLKHKDIRFTKELEKEFPEVVFVSKTP